MKQCKICKEHKELGQFSSSKVNAGGKVPRCKSCVKAKVNKEAQKAASKRYRDRHPEKRFERDKLYRQHNSNKVREMRNKRLKERYREDPIYRLQTILRQQVVDYIKHKKNERTAQLLGYTAEDFIARYGEGGVNDHIDHKIPKSWFKDDAPINIVWHIENLHWLSGVENCSKYNKFCHPVSNHYLQLALPHVKKEFACELQK